MAKDSTKPVIDWEKIKQRPKIRTKAENFVSVYSNSMNVEITFNDFKVFFGEILEASEEKLVTEDRVVILMTPEQARLISDVLVQQLEKYEATYGSIREPPGGLE